MTVSPRPLTSTETPIVRRIDHILVRVDDAQYDALYTLLADTLRLPAPWPPTEYPSLRSGGIFAGNVDLEILYTPADRRRGPARCHGLVFEAWSEDTGVLAQRGIAFLPVTQAGAAPHQPTTARGAYTFFAPMFGGTPWSRTRFSLKRLAATKFRMGNAGRGHALEFMFDDIYRHGVAVMAAYDPARRDVNAARRISAAQLAARSGGALGLVRVREVVIGTTQLTASSSQWRSLLRPAREETALCWQSGDGPAIRVIASDHDGIHHLIWEVVSLAHAQAVLEDLGLLGLVLPDALTLDPEQCCGLDIRLVEA
jgi:hypothetical protein